MSTEKSPKVGLFAILFTVLGLLALQVPVVHLTGSKATLSLFNMLAPVASGFVGSLPGMLAVFFMQVCNALVHGNPVFTGLAFLGFMSMVSATLYFSKNRIWSLLVPVAAIVSFNLNPIGRSAWQYSLFWLIPFVAYFWAERSLVARALGATFTAHAFGGLWYVWAFHLPKAVWLGLIPVVAQERAMFTVGICVSYVVFNTVLHTLVAWKFPKLATFVDSRYALGAKAV